MRTYHSFKQPIKPDAAYNMKTMLVRVHRLRQMSKQYERLKTIRRPTPYRSRDRRFSWAFLEAVHQTHQTPTESQQPYISFALAPFAEPHELEKVVSGRRVNSVCSGISIGYDEAGQGWMKERIVERVWRGNQSRSKFCSLAPRSWPPI